MKLLKTFLTIITLTPLAFSVGCATSIDNSSETSYASSIVESSEVISPYMEIYSLYKANGGTMSYEEWLLTIKGEKGDPGKDGLTPFIGGNGNWWIGDNDTGVKAEGEYKEQESEYEKFKRENPNSNLTEKEWFNCLINRFDVTKCKGITINFEANSTVPVTACRIVYDTTDRSNYFMTPTSYKWALPEPSSDTLYFEGWYYDTEYTNPFSLIDSNHKLINIDHDITVYAKMTPATSSDLIIWATASEEQVIRYVVDKYNSTATDNNKIRVKYKAVAEGDTGTEVAKDPSAKSAPELFLVADDHIYNLQSKGIIVDLTSAYGETISNNNTDIAVACATYNDKVYGFPVTNDNGYFLWYNKDKVSATQAETLEGLLEAAKTANSKVLLDIANGWYAPTFFFAPEVCGTESLKFKENADGDVVYDITWDTDKAAAAFTAVNSLIDEGKGTYKNNFTTGGNDAIVAGFKDGSVVAAVSGTWMQSDLETAIGADKLAATKLPTYSVGTVKAQMGTFTGSKLYCLNATKGGEDGANRRAKAAMLADLLTNEDAQVKRYELRNSIPTNNNALIDIHFESTADIGQIALKQQLDAAAAVQSKCTEARYWDIGATIGHAMLNGNIGTYANTQAFLKAECDILRGPSL